MDTPADTITKLQFLPEENTTQEDVTLYTVDLNELQPLNVPFMMPGIYKKICMPLETQNQLMTANVNNVIIAEPNHDIQRAYDKQVAGHHHIDKREQLAKYAAVAPNNVLDLLANKLLKTTNEANLIIDRQHNEVIRLPTSYRTKQIYRIITPSDLGLYFDDDSQKSAQATTAPSNKCTKPKAKLGRPRKQCVGNREETSKSPPIVVNNAATEQTAMPKQRTRSGRIVHMMYRNITLSNKESTKELLAELRDSDYKCKTDVVPQADNAAAVDNVDSASTTEKPKRYVPPESICAGCNKIFLGKRMHRHLAQHPDHIKPIHNEQISAPASATTATQCTSDNVTLFNFLINKLHSNPQLSEDQRADLFLNELDDFVNQLQLRSSRLIHNTTGLHTISGRSSRVLGIPEGQYALDLTALVAQPESEVNCLGNDEHLIPPTSVNTRSLDYTGISLDGTLTDEAAQKLNLSAGGKLLPPSEESLLRAVDDLVQTNIKKLNVTSTTTGYDHVSDNAVEAVTIMKETKSVADMQQSTPILDLSVEFFQFNNN